MNSSALNTQINLLLLSIVFIFTCSSQDKPILSEKSNTSPVEIPKTEPQIAEYIRHIFQDKNGNFWFGTNGYGVAYFNGDSLTYFSNAQGFNGQQITGIAEDPEKNIWFATDQGVVKYDWTSDEDDRKRFTNYTDQQYFGGQHFWSVLADSKSNVWAGSATGIFRFDGKKWASFELPYPDEVAGEFITRGTTWGITEDRAGNIWFTTNGFGAFKYDGKAFNQYTKKDGLTDDSIDQILEDRNGNIWFGTRYGGLSRFDGEHFVNFTQRNSIIGNDEVCAIFEDKAGNIWFSSEGYGVYRYDGASFTNFFKKQGLEVRAVQTIFEDKKSRLWVGGGGGLYRLEGETFINVTKNGPWK